VPLWPVIVSQCSRVDESSEDFGRQIDLLESELKRLEAEYNMFFAGRLPRPPWETRARVDALMKRQQEESQRTVEEVPLLTEIVAHASNAEAPATAPEDSTLAADIERVLVVRLVPELNKQIAGLRSELEKQLRRSVREAVEHALAARKADPGKK